MTPDIIIQLLSLVVYAAAILWGGLAMLDIRRSSHQIAIKYVASALVLLSVATAVAFSAAQSYWTLTGEIKSLSFSETAIWLLYDWLNGLSHLAVVLAVRAFMRWQLPTPCQAGGVCPCGALARKDKEQDRKLSGIASDIDKLQRRIEHLQEMDCD